MNNGNQEKLQEKRGSEVGILMVRFRGEKRGECSRLRWEPSKDQIRNNSENGEQIKVWFRVGYWTSRYKGKSPLMRSFILTASIYRTRHVSGATPAAGSAAILCGGGQGRLDKRQQDSCGPSSRGFSCFRLLNP